jgi:hypothetical protein
LKAWVALIVPSVELRRGMPSVAEFVRQTIEQANGFNVQLVSLATSATSARDEIGVALTTRRESVLRRVCT